MAKKMSLIARWGSSCGTPFDAGAFFKQHIQWNELEPYIKDRPNQPWTEFTLNKRVSKNKTKNKVERKMKLKRTFRKSTAKKHF